MSTQPMYVGQGLLKVDPALTGLLAPRGADATTDDVAAQANTTPDDRFAGLLAPQSQAPQPFDYTGEAGQNAGTSPQMPTFPGATPSIAPSHNPRRDLLSRVHDSVLGLFGSNSNTPGEQTGYEGLLSPEDIASTKSHGLFGGLIHGPGASASEIRQQKLATLLTGRQMVAKQQQAQDIAAKRQQIYQSIGLPKDGDPTADREWATKFYAMSLMQNPNDVDAIKALQPIVTNSLKPSAAATPKDEGDYFVNTKTGVVQSFSRQAGTVIGPDWKKVQTSSSGTPIIFSGTKNGKPDYQPVNPNDDEKMASLVAQGYKPDIDSRTQYVQGMVQGRADNSLLARTQNAYTTQTKPLTDQAEVYNKAYQTLDRAANATDPNERKLLYGAVESQFTQASEQAKNLRFQLLQYYTKNQNPSLGNTFATFFDRLTKGELPPNVLQPMLSHIRALAAENKSQIDAHRNAFLKTHQSVVSDVDLPSSDSYYTYPGLMQGANPASPAAPSGTYSPNNPFAKRKP